MKPKLLITMRFPLAAILAFALVKCSDNKAATSMPSEDAIAVKLQPVQRGSYNRPLQYAGLIASNEEAKLSFKISGIISKIYVKEGDHVSPGELLASLDLTEINAQVQQAAQNVEKTTRDENRIKNLFRDTVASLEQLQNAHTQFTVAEQALRIAKFNQQYAQIRATTGGTILQKLQNEGELASPGTAVFLFNGTQKNDWVVRFGVSDKDWAVLRKGDKASISLDAYPNTTLAGEVTKIAEGADPVSGTYPVEVRVFPAGVKLAPGLFCTIQLQPSQKQTLTLIPIESLAEGNGKMGFVYTLNADKRTVQKRSVRVAFILKDKIAVSSGLDSINEVITDGAGYLTEKAIVKVSN